MPILYIRDELNQEWLPVVSELGAIPDITFPNGVTNGHALIYHSGSGVWTSGSVGSGTSGPIYLDDLENVYVPSPNNGDILRYNTSAVRWEAFPYSGSSGESGSGGASYLDDLLDVSITTPSSGQVVYWNGSGWVNDSGPIEQKVIAIVIPGTLSTGVKALRLYYPFSSGSMKFTRIVGGVATAPTGSSLTFIVRRTTLTVGTVSITTGNYIGSTDSITQSYWTAGYYLDINITAIGSTVAGSDLAIQIVADGIGLTKARVT